MYVYKLLNCRTAILLYRRLHLSTPPPPHTHTVAPEFTVQPETISVLNHTLAQLNCSAKGEPPPIITWTHNGDMVTPDDRISIDSNGSLIISIIALSDMGNYRCLATNLLGVMESDDALLMVDCECCVCVCVCVVCI